MIYVYFVSYSVPATGSVGRSEIGFDHEITSIDDIAKIESCLSDSHHDGNLVVVNNYQLMRVEKTNERQS